MAQPTIIWTFLPNGVEKGKLKFSAAVSFRLPESAGSHPNLALYPEILAWPETLKAVKFSAELEKGGGAVKVERTSPDPDPELWKAIFQSDSPVNPFKFTDLSVHPLIAYPARQVQAFLAEQYITTAVEHPEEPPALDKVLRPEGFGRIRMKPLTRTGFTPLAAQKTEPVLRQEVQKTLDTQKVKAMPVSASLNPPQDFYLVRRVHQPLSKSVIDPVTKQKAAVRVPLKPPDLDFHQAVALIGQYPALMRLLGLAVDFEMDLPPDFPRTGSIRIVPGARQDYMPWTKFIYEAPRLRFAAAPKDSKPDVVDGFLDLSDDDQYDIIQIDLDGAALKAVEFSDEGETKDSAELPSLRAGGLSVVRTGHAVSIAARIKSGTDNNGLFESRRPTTFYAEDLIQGYRVDVWDDRSKMWNSLCRRTGTFRFTRIDREITLEDEGYVSSAVTQAADESNADMYTHESLFCWEGWSLVAPRPGKAINPQDNPEEIQNSATTAFRLETKFKPVAKSLPRLRYGTGYRLRARAVDLAGNGLGSDVTDASHAIPPAPQAPHVYSRFDPIAPPVLVLREAAKRGESLDDVVIRSFNDAEPKDAQSTGETAERHMAPPKTAQLTAEIHSMFDTGAGLNPDVYAMLCAKDGGAFLEVEPGEAVALPYLPDPWAKGLTVRGLPHQTIAKPMQIEFPGDWPEKKVLRLKVAEGGGAPAWDASSRILTVFLKKGEKTTLRLSSYLHEDKVPDLGLYRWLDKPQLAIHRKFLGPTRAAQVVQAQPLKTQSARSQATAAGAQVKPAAVSKTAEVRSSGLIQLPAVNIGQFKLSAAQGLHWMMTPYRDITITHAVQQPVGRPAKIRFEADKVLGDTFATLDAELAVHAWSTAKIDILAEWQEPVDNIMEKSWKTISGRAHVLDLAIDRDIPSLVLDPADKHRHEFHDTKYRNITYRVVATSRYREQMPKEIGDDPDKVSRTSDPIVAPVLNSAPPALPKVLYVVPTFGWERKREAGKLTSIRTGGGLRVYLERPWFSSGEGELLAAILYSPTAAPEVRRVATSAASTEKPAAGRTPARPQAQLRVKPRTAQAVQPKAAALAVVAPSVPEDLRPYVSLWGLDPLWRSGDTSTPEYPAASEFRTAASVMHNLTLNEMPGVARFSAVGHEVKFDEERGLWFCDLDIAPKDAYFPFVRLALARFQPNSVAGAHLSRVVQADFIQLVPGRAASVVFDKPGAGAKSLNVTVAGVSYIQSAGGGPSDIEASLETRASDIEGELGWTAVSNSTVALQAQRMPNLAPGHFTWTAKINLPTAKGAKPYRLVIREYETFVSDEIDKTAHATAAVLKKARRLVFAEAVEL